MNSKLGTSAKKDWQLIRQDLVNWKNDIKALKKAGWGLLIPISMLVFLGVLIWKGLT